MDIRKIIPAKHAMTLYEEFKSFAFKGNVIDLAVGVIVGGTFSNIIKSLVDNVIMPLLGVLHPGERHYEHWELVLRGQEIRYGRFLSDLVNFLVVSAALFFLIVKFLGWIMKEKQVEEAAEEASPPPPTKDQELLMEIRDLLKQTVERAPATTAETPPPQAP